MQLNALALNNGISVRLILGMNVYEPLLNLHGG